MWVYKLAFREAELVQKERKESDTVGRLVFTGLIHLVR
jgi:hypothetical protein